MIRTDNNFEKIAQGLLKNISNAIFSWVKKHPKFTIGSIFVGPPLSYITYQFGKGYSQGQAPTDFDPKTILIGTLLGLGGGGLYHMIEEDEKDEEENEKSLERALIAGALLGTGAGALLSAFYEGI